MPFGAIIPREVIAKVERNDPALTKVDLCNNATFQMKTLEYCTSLAAAMAGNTHVKEIILKDCCITDQDVRVLSTMLTTNGTLELLNLEGNKIGSDGAICLADALASNGSLRDLFLLGQEKKAFGETCLEAWLKCLQDNIAIQSIKWRLDSRKSFALNQFLTRNKEIARRKRDNRDFADLLPQSLRPPETMSSPKSPKSTTPCEVMRSPSAKSPQLTASCEAMRSPPELPSHASLVAEAVQAGAH